MGTWGVAIFSDDYAADLREDFRDLIGDGCSSSQAVDKLLSEYNPANDPDEEPVFWLALAATQWKLGRLEERTKKRALSIIDDGTDLRRWDDAKVRTKRETVLKKLKTQLLSPQPEAKRIAKRFVANNNWEIGELIGFQLQSTRWVLLRVIGHHVDKGGKSAVVELLDWIGDSLPESINADKLPVKKMLSPYKRYPQFLISEPRTKQQLARIKQTGIISRPSQQKAGFQGLTWPYWDKLIFDYYGLE